MKTIPLRKARTVVNEYRRAIFESKLQLASSLLTRSKKMLIDSNVQFETQPNAYSLDSEDAYQFISILHDNVEHALELIDDLQGAFSDEN